MQQGIAILGSPCSIVSLFGPIGTKTAGLAALEAGFPSSPSPPPSPPSSPAWVAKLWSPP